MRIRPVSHEALVARVVARIASMPDWVRVAVDGADAARPGELADALAGPLRERGRPTVRVRAEDHLRAASLRFERGREDPDSFYEDWLDAAGLVREVLDPLGRGGDGRIRPVRFDARNDRASRAGFVAVAPGTVLLLSGPLLLGRGLPLELTVHLELGAAALARRTPPALAWTLPAYERYATEVQPGAWADLVVRVDDPRHPAVIERD
ncbi:MAG TPA: uridine kinase [Micromonosporaceae bacterium]